MSRNWQAILDAIKRERRVAWMLLSNASVFSLEDNVLTIRFARDGDVKGFTSSGCDADLQRVLSGQFGLNVKIRALSAGDLAIAGGGRSRPDAGSSRPVAPGPAQPPAGAGAAASWDAPGPGAPAAQGQDRPAGQDRPSRQDQRPAPGGPAAPRARGPAGAADPAGPGSAGSGAPGPRAAAAPAPTDASWPDDPWPADDSAPESPDFDTSGAQAGQSGQSGQSARGNQSGQSSPSGRNGHSDQGARGASGARDSGARDSGNAQGAQSNVKVPGPSTGFPGDLDIPDAEDMASPGTIEITGMDLIQRELGGKIIGEIED